MRQRDHGVVVPKHSAGGEVERVGMQVRVANDCGDIVRIE